MIANLRMILPPNGFVSRNFRHPPETSTRPAGSSTARLHQYCEQAEGGVAAFVAVHESAFGKADVSTQIRMSDYEGYSGQHLLDVRFIAFDLKRTSGATHAGCTSDWKIASHDR
jgi:hypothetical protein